MFSVRNLTFMAVGTLVGFIFGVRYGVDSSVRAFEYLIDKAVEKINKKEGKQ